MLAFEILTAILIARKAISTGKVSSQAETTIEMPPKLGSHAGTSYASAIETRFGNDPAYH
jgi:hypothetical protein